MTTASPGIAPDDRFATSLRGLGPVGLLAVVVIFLAGNVAVGRMVAIPLGALLVLAWAWRSQTPWRAIGYVRPRSWVRTIVLGIAIGVTFKLVMKSIVMPLLGAPPVNQAYHFLAGNAALLPAAIWASLVAGFGEETVFRGFLFERLGRLLGPGVGARTAIVILTAALFGLAHYPDQGLAGAQQATITALVLGTLYVNTGQIVLPMIVHAAFDLAAVAIIYLDRELDVTRLFWN